MSSRNAARPYWIAFALLATLAYPCWAAHWQDVGNAGASPDKIYVDVDSVADQDGERVVTIMTIYANIHANANNLNQRTNRYTQQIIFDCAKQRFTGLGGVYSMDTKPVWAVAKPADWKDHLTPVPADETSQRIVKLACNSQAINGAPASSNGLEVKKPLVFTGTGFTINREGYVLTNNHVVDGCKNIEIRSGDTAQTAAIVEAVDPKNDLALLKTHIDFKQVASFRSATQATRLGESIGVIGFPLTGLLSAEPKATFGEVSSVAGVNNDYSLLQISAPIQAGNSGSPVLDRSGLVIGIAVSQLSSAIAAKIGSVPQNVNFAIRGELAQIFLSAHGIKFTATEDGDKLETEDIAAVGRGIANLIICQRPQ